MGVSHSELLIEFVLEERRCVFRFLFHDSFGQFYFMIFFVCHKIFTLAFLNYFCSKMSLLAGTAVGHDAETKTLHKALVSNACGTSGTTIAGVEGVSNFAKFLGVFHDLGLL